MDAVRGWLTLRTGSRTVIRERGTQIVLRGGGPGSSALVASFGQWLLSVIVDPIQIAGSVRIGDPKVVAPTLNLRVVFHQNS